MATAQLSKVFHGQETDGEFAYPGSGGNMNSVYAGAGSYEAGRPEDVGYQVGKFPAGALPTGAETQEFRLSDSDAFTGLRGIAKTNFPFKPNPSNDHPNMKTSALSDNFGVHGSMLSSGRHSYKSAPNSLSQEILDGFTAGTSTYNSLPNAAGPWGSNNFDELGKAGDKQTWQGVRSHGVSAQYAAAGSYRDVEDIPATPFHKVYPNFGDGAPDYGFSEPGQDSASSAVVRAFSAVLPEGQLAGTKRELMPVFSGINVEAVETRPILQSLGKQKNTLYLGGLTELPPELKINPMAALTSGSNIPADMVQSTGELRSALHAMGQNRADGGLSSGSAYGKALPRSQMMKDNAARMPRNFYDYVETDDGMM